MSAADAPTFACESCGKRYRWKPQYAGRQVKCACGHVMTPTEPPPAAPAGDDLDALYDLAPDPAKLAAAQSAPAPDAEAGAAACPSCSAALEPGQALCIQCGFNLKTGTRVKTQVLAGARGGPASGTGGGGGGAGAAAIATTTRSGVPVVPGYRRLSPKEQEERSNFGIAGDLFKDFYLPIILVGVGIVLSFVDALWGQQAPSFAAAAVYVCIYTLVNFVLVTIGVLITARLMELGLGPIGQCLIKVAAVALIPAAIERTFGGPRFGPGMGYVGWAASLLITFGLFMLLFDMDLNESMFCTVVIWVIQTWAAGLLIFMLFKGILFSAPAGGGGGLFGGDDDGDGPGKPVPGLVEPGDDDDDDEGMDDEPAVPPASQPATQPGAWITPAPAGLFGGTPRRSAPMRPLYPCFIFGDRTS